MLEDGAKAEYVIDSKGSTINFSGKYEVLYYETDLFRHGIKTEKALFGDHPDMAIIRIPALAGRTFIPIPSQSEPLIPKETSVAAIGFHYFENQTQSELRLAVGKVSYADEHRVLASTPIKPGYSGCPLVDQRGVLVGIATASGNSIGTGYFESAAKLFKIIKNNFQYNSPQKRQQVESPRDFHANEPSHVDSIWSFPE